MLEEEKEQQEELEDTEEDEDSEDSEDDSNVNLEEEQEQIKHPLISSLLLSIMVLPIFYIAAMYVPFVMNYRWQFALGIYVIYVIIQYLMYKPKTKREDLV